MKWLNKTPSICLDRFPVSLALGYWCFWDWLWGIMFNRFYTEFKLKCFTSCGWTRISRCDFLNFMWATNPFSISVQTAALFCHRLSLLIMLITWTQKEKSCHAPLKTLTSKSKYSLVFIVFVPFHHFMQQASMKLIKNVPIIRKWQIVVTWGKKG